MKKLWILQKKENDEWVDKIVYANYLKFCGETKKAFNADDDIVISALKEKVNKQNCGQFIYTDDIKNEFRDAHRSVIDQYRVINGEVPDDCEKKDYGSYTFVKENEGVKFTLWNNRQPSKKKIDKKKKK